MATSKLTVNFGMVSIPVKLEVAAEDRKRVDLHQYHFQCGSRVRQPKWCPACEKMLEGWEVQKGYEIDEATHVLLSADDFASLPLKSIKQIEIVEFIAFEQIDTRCFSKPYFLTPQDTPHHKPYRLLMLAMEAVGKVAVAKLTRLDREHLAIIRCFDGILMLQTLHYADELRDYQKLKPQEYVVFDRELEVAQQLIKAMVNPDFDLSKYHDEYREALEKVIESKVSGTALPEVPEEVPAQEGDVFDALVASLKMVEAGK